MLFVKKGFTITELIVVTGVTLILLAIIYFNLFRSQRQVTLDTTINILVNDIKNQQNKAMTGKGEAGIYFQGSEYVLFNGSSYSSGEPTNFVYKLSETTTFAPINFPSAQIVFTPSTGEVASFDPNQNTITISDSYTGEQKTLTINRYGVITGVN